MIRSIEWAGDRVRFIDQTKLPTEEMYIETDRPSVLAEAITSLKIRGAPALGVAAAYGLVLGLQHSKAEGWEKLTKSFEETASMLQSTRPTAVNLSWAIERMRARLRQIHQSWGLVSANQSECNSPRDIVGCLLDEAKAIHREDEEMCAAIGRYGNDLVPQRAAILTHCNTGALATGGEGTAQAIITTAAAQGKNISVYADETRPLLQGARLTAWELQKQRIAVTLITDNAAAFVMKRKKIDLVVVGADRIAANGDTANKIGTYNVAIIAKEHGIPFYVAAPTSTIDVSLLHGEMIPIEERQANEVTEGFGTRSAPYGVNVFNPAFDITPGGLITAIVTERGVLRPPYAVSISETMKGALLKTSLGKDV
ncbi:MAG: S-methyl-5-thioribose-1-phosphate isomerase [Bacteroidota bacterium]|nr:S-methyl-5-thioribose-1-phosphate isomerase [Bacteroidota bacterium]